MTAASPQTVLTDTLAKAGSDHVYIVTVTPGSHTVQSFSCSQCGARGTGDDPGSTQHREGCPYAS